MADDITVKRPEYVMENHEDVIYHDNIVYTEPGFCAFTRKSWVFNKYMQWIDDDLDDCILCYSQTDNLLLTGEKQASIWHSDPINTICEYSDLITFTKKSLTRQIDCAILPAFQFHIDQHPVLELEVLKASSDWQFCIFVKGRSGIPLICSGWKRKPCKISFDIAAVLHDRGYDLKFAELHFVIGTWNEEKSREVILNIQGLYADQGSIGNKSACNQERRYR